MANNHSSALLCYQIASKDIEQHRNVIVDYKKIMITTPVTVTGFFLTPVTHIEYGCSKYNGTKKCPECKRAKKFAIMDMVLIPFTLGGWWLLGYIITCNSSKSDLVGITRKAAIEHSRITNTQPVYNTDGSQYKYNGKFLVLYNDS